MKPLFALFLTATLLPTQSAMAQNLETQSYTVLDTMDGMEIRYYPPVMKIQSDNNFNALFRYISGENQSGTEIAMTTPVYMGDSEGNRVMEFVLPAAFDETNTPSARSAGVRVFESEPGYYAAVSFGGYASASSRESATRRLMALAAQHDMKTTGEPMLLVYNSPYQFFNRKNEILVRLEGWEK